MAMDKVYWDRVSPLLDALLATDPPQRVARLAELRQRDPSLAAEVDPLLAQHAAIEAARFLEQPVFKPFDAIAGRTVGNYTLERQLGQGGMGAVWLAHRSDGRFEGVVAIKFLDVALMAHGGLERFEREGRVLARLTHANIAKLLDAGVDAGQPYLVLEYVDGESIDRWCRAHPLDVSGRLRLFRSVLAAVAHAHGKLILHRDLKPTNILVTGEGSVKLLDFGIAKLLDESGQPVPVTELTEAGGRLYTVEYAAPEQLTSGEVSTATDVYALGVLLYELLTGTRPYKPTRESRAELERAILTEDPPPPSRAIADRSRSRALAGDLDTIVLKALKKLPSERYATVNALLEDVDRYLAGQPVLATADSTWYRARKFVARNRVAVTAGALVLCAILGGAAVSLWQAGVARAEARRAEQVKTFIASIFTQATPREGTGGAVTAADLLLAAGKRVDTELADDPRTAVELGVIIGDSFSSLGEPERAVPILETLVARAEQSYGSTHPMTLRAKVRLVEGYHVDGQFEKSKPLLERLVPDLLAQPPDDVDITVQVLSSLSFVQAKYNEAERSYESLKQAIAISESGLGRLHFRTIYEIGLLGNTYGRFGERRLQLEAAEEAVKRGREAFGAQRPHSDLTFVERWYGAALSAAGRYDEATPILEDVLRDQRALDQVDTARVRVAMQDLASNYFELGRDGEALPLMQKVVELEAAQVSEETSDRALTLSVLGNMLVNADRVEEGLQWIERSVKTADDLKLPEPASWRHARVNRHALAMSRLGRHEEAERLLVGLAAERTTLQPIQASRLSLLRAANARLSARVEEATTYALEAVAQSDAPNVPWMARTAAATELGYVHLARGHVNDAQAAFDKARATLPKNHTTPTTRTAALWIGLAQLELLRGQPREAERLLEPAAAAWKAVAPTGDSHGYALHWLARAQAQLGKTREASDHKRLARSILASSRIPAFRQLARE